MRALWVIQLIFICQITKKPLTGYYIGKAEQLCKEKRISQGKKEEYLLEALREDLVYGDKRENEYIID